MAPKSTRATKAASLKAQLSSKNADIDLEKTKNELDEALLDVMERKVEGPSDTVEITKTAIEQALATSLKGSDVGTKQVPRETQEASLLSGTETALVEQDTEDPEIESKRAMSPSDEEEEGRMEETEKYTVSEGLPGAGTVVVSLHTSDLEEVKANIGLIKLKRVNDITKLGYRVIKTSYGEKELTPYSQLMIRAASLYYNDIKNVGYSSDAIRAIHYATATDAMRLEMIEENKSRPVKDFLEREQLKYFAFVLQGLLVEEQHFTVIDIFSVISEAEMKSRLSALETHYKDAYHIYSLVSEMVTKGTNILMPVPSFLKSSSSLCSYVDAVAVGKRHAEELTFSVPRRVFSGLAAAETTTPMTIQEKRTRTEKDDATGHAAQKRAKTIPPKSMPITQTPGLVRDTSTFEDFTELVSYFEKKLEGVIEQQQKNEKVAANHREEVNKKLTEMSRAIRSLVVDKSEAKLASNVNVNKTFRAAGMGSSADLSKQEGKKVAVDSEFKEEEDLSDEAKDLIKEISVFQTGDQEELAEKANRFLKEHGEEQFKVSPALLLVSSYRKRLMTIIRGYENRG